MVPMELTMDRSLPQSKTGPSQKPAAQAHEPVGRSFSEVSMPDTLGELARELTIPKHSKDSVADRFGGKYQIGPTQIVTTIGEGS